MTTQSRPEEDFHRRQLRRLRQGRLRLLVFVGTSMRVVSRDSLAIQSGLQQSTTQTHLRGDIPRYHLWYP